MPCPKRLFFAKVISWSALALVSAAFTGCQMMNGYAANNLGSAYYREGNYVAARQSFYQAVAEMPENPDFRYNLAAAMRKQGDLAGAEQIYRQVLHVDPSHQPSYHGMAELMIQQGRQAEANQMINSWVATQPYSPTAHVEMAWLHEQQGNQFAAAQSLQQALRIEPNHPTALAHLGQVYQESGQPELAVAVLSKIASRKLAATGSAKPPGLLEPEYPRPSTHANGLWSSARDGRVRSTAPTANGLATSAKPNGRVASDLFHSSNSAGPDGTVFDDGIRCPDAAAGPNHLDAAANGRAAIRDARPANARGDVAAATHAG